jgi:dipeptidyl-peptidase-4
MSTNPTRYSGRITPTDVATYPWPGLAIPGSFEFSPDDRLITYLFSPEGSLKRQLFGFNPETGEHFAIVRGDEHGISEENVDLEVALRRERQRQRGTGVTKYHWANKEQKILVPLDDGLYVLDSPDSDRRKILETGKHAAIDPRFSPDASWVAYVQDSELYVLPSSGGDSRQITFGARGSGKTNGLAEYIAQEEMGRMRGYWWSPDNKTIAFVEVDETHIPVYRIVHQGSSEVGEGAQEDHRYPFVGKANARIRLGVVGVTGDKPVYMDLGIDEDIYLARVKWLPDGRLSAQIENRGQTSLDLVVFDPQTGKRKLLVSERSNVWINLHEMFIPLRHKRSDGGCFVWASEKDGFRHLYLLDADGKEIRQLTRGEWQVDEIACTDEENGLIYFMGNRESPIERQLYVISMDGGEISRLTPQTGFHSVVVDHHHERFVDIHHSLEKPPTVIMHSIDDSGVRLPIFEQNDPRIDNLNLTPPEKISFKSRAGVLLRGLIYRPPSRFGNGPYPTLVSVYGGPHAQSVVDGWGPTANLRAQFLSNQGYLVLMVDNQGTSRRGLDFESVIKNDMGHLEVEDQVDGVRWLVEKRLTDSERVGIYGWSYGGYMACMCLARAPKVFKAAMAGAPVSHWDGYDTFYTERYMGTPESNPQGYKTGSVMHHVDNIKGSLMLVHGMIDENVHFRHTARLINALTSAGKKYELLIFPDARHGPRKLVDRVYMEERILEFFQRTI